MPTNNSRLPERLYSTYFNPAAMRFGPPHSTIIKYIGTMVTSHIMKNRKASSAVKTTNMAPSTNRINIMKAFNRDVIDSHDPSTQSGGSMVVSNTSNKLMPSTPTAYSMPKVGIHSKRSTNCMPASTRLNWFHR